MKFEYHTMNNEFQKYDNFIQARIRELYPDNLKYEYIIEVVFPTIRGQINKILKDITSKREKSIYFETLTSEELKVFCQEIDTLFENEHDCVIKKNEVGQQIYEEIMKLKKLTLTKGTV